MNVNHMGDNHQHYKTIPILYIIIEVTSDEVQIYSKISDLQNSKLYTS